MKWKYLFLTLLFFIILIPSLMYFGSIDWSRNHQKSIENLPFFDNNADTGKFRLKINDFEFLVRISGMKNSGKNIILLHGFPESSIMWEAFITQASKQGYRVLAFDQRGYSPKARPKKTADYHINLLVDDVINVAKAVGFEQFHVVGHDWGAAVAWKLTMDFPQKIESLTAMSVPHIGAFFKGVVSDTNQQKRSSYFAFFQKPILPEFMLTYNGQKNLKNLLSKLPKKDFDEYIAILSENGALTAELNWYRAMNINEFAISKDFEKPINRPTLFIWGSEDEVIAKTVIENQKKYIKSSYKELALKTGHNLIQMKEKEVIDAILTHLSN